MLPEAYRSSWQHPQAQEIRAISAAMTLKAMTRVDDNGSKRNFTMNASELVVGLSPFTDEIKQTQGLALKYSPLFPGSSCWLLQQPAAHLQSQIFFGLPPEVPPILAAAPLQCALRGPTHAWAASASPFLNPLPAPCRKQRPALLHASLGLVLPTD